LPPGRRKRLGRHDLAAGARPSGTYHFERTATAEDTARPLPWNRRRQYDHGLPYRRLRGGRERLRLVGAGERAQLGLIAQHDRQIAAILERGREHRADQDLPQAFHPEHKLVRPVETASAPPGSLGAHHPALQCSEDVDLEPQHRGFLVAAQRLIRTRGLRP
jgi:hypothetical protein